MCRHQAVNTPRQASLSRQSTRCSETPLSAEIWNELRAVVPWLQRYEALQKWFAFLDVSFTQPAKSMRRGL